MFSFKKFFNISLAEGQGSGGSCRNCGAIIKSNTVENLAPKIQEEMVVCKNCGKKISEKAFYCPYCHKIPQVSKELNGSTSSHFFETDSTYELSYAIVNLSFLILAVLSIIGLIVAIFKSKILIIPILCAGVGLFICYVFTMLKLSFYKDVKYIRDKLYEEKKK